MDVYNKEDQVAFVFSHGILDGRTFFIVRSNYFNVNESWYIHKDGIKYRAGYAKELIGPFVILIYVKPVKYNIPPAA